MSVAPDSFSASTALLATLARSPLVHFLVLGGALFAVAPRRADPRRVVLTSASLSSLERAQATRNDVSALTHEKAREVDSRAIEDEVLYREAVRLGLDKDDPIVRQRLVQKLLLLVEDLGGASRAPTDQELRAYFDADPTRWRLPSRVHFIQVFASHEGALPPADSLPATGIPVAGEAFPYPREMTGSRQEIARLYGDAFARAVVDLPPSAGFSAPIHSSLGWHRVRVVEEIDGAVPSFEEARHGLELEYAMDRRRQVVGDYLKKTVGDYEIDVDGARLRDFTPTTRVAIRSDPSGED